MSRLEKWNKLCKHKTVTSIQCVFLHSYVAAVADDLSCLLGQDFQSWHVSDTVEMRLTVM